MSVPELFFKALLFGSCGFLHIFALFYARFRYLKYKYIFYYIIYIVIPISFAAEPVIFMNFLSKDNSLDRHSDTVLLSIIVSILPMFSAAIFGYWLGNRNLKNSKR